MNRIFVCTLCILLVTILVSSSKAELILGYVSAASTSNPTIAASAVATGLSGVSLAQGGGLTATSGADMEL